MLVENFFCSLREALAFGFETFIAFRLNTFKATLADVYVVEKTCARKLLSLVLAHYTNKWQLLLQIVTTRYDLVSGIGLRRRGFSLTVESVHLLKTPV